MSPPSSRLPEALRTLGMKETDVEETLRLVEANPAEALAKFRAILKPVAPDVVEELERRARVGPGQPTLRIPVDPEFGFETARQILSPGQGYLLIERKPGLARRLMKAYTSRGQEGLLLDFDQGLALAGPKVAVARALESPEHVVEALESFLAERRRAAVLAELRGDEDISSVERALDAAMAREAVLIAQAEPDTLSPERRTRLQKKFWTVTSFTEKGGRRRPVETVSLTRPTG